MIRKKLLRHAAASTFVLGLAAVALSQNVASAQDPPAPPPPAPTAAPAAGANPTDPPQGAGLSRQVNIPPAEQLQQADGDLARMESSRDNVRRQLMAARQERDVVKTLCLNDKLTQLNVAITSAQERRDSLAAAVKGNDADLATHEFTILSVLRQRSDQLSTEANQCIGEEVGFAGQSSVDMTVEDIPVDDPSDFPKFDLDLPLPQCASCFG